MNFQQVVLMLQEFWANQGCILQQPIDQETGAGTLNPATFLRVLGEEPWNVAYVEPCRRPNDGRYGQNPYRLGAYYQFQVIMKPSPPNIQEIYLDSLRALGIDPCQHDIRFVEDDWEQPTLGASGLGWEVWADGMEVTQYTYFQQTGQLQLYPTAVELTYGLERICMYIQGVDSVYDLEWVDGIRYGDVHSQSEVEYSTYSFEDADTDLLRRHLDDYEKEAIRLMEKGLVLPGYDFALKANHAFNVLDARGAISVTERQNYIGLIRRLARTAAKSYVARREELGYPLLKEPHAPHNPEVPAPDLSAALQNKQLFVEIGSEEIPARFINNALVQLREKLAHKLKEARLAHGEIHVAGTPRRLTVWVDDLVAQQEDREEVRTGPPVRAAYRDGKLTRAAEGFARKQGVDPNDLYTVDTKRGEYIAAKVHHKGRATLEIHPAMLRDVIATLSFPKSMTWGVRKEKFARPLQWFCALYGGQVVPFAYAGIASGNQTRGHRFIPKPEPIVVTDAAQYVEALRKANVIVMPDERRAMISKELEALAKQGGGRVVADPGLLEEVSNLVENPWGQLGHFAPENLRLPREVLISSMRSHQRYFALEDHQGNLLPSFVVFSNTNVEDPAVVAHGNERVLKARLHDAVFFYDEDRKKRLETRLPILSRTRFLRELDKIGVPSDVGSRVTRIERVAESVARAAFAGQEKVLADTKRAAQLCKADLATLMVGEFPDLQGLIGSDYALGDGENAEVAQAIGEQYKPRNASDTVAKSAAGICLALADKLELIAACYAVGAILSGNKDPHGLRRAALGVLRTLEDNGLDLNLRALVHDAVQTVRGQEHQEDVDKIVSFVGGRLRAELVDTHRVDIVDAVMMAGYDRPQDTRRRVDALSAVAQEADLAPLGEAFKRIHNILEKNAEAVRENLDFQATLATQAEEKVLGQLAGELKVEMDLQVQQGNYRAALGHIVRLREPLDAFFTQVLVMHKDTALRNNRLALLQGLHKTFSSLADISRIQVRSGNDAP